MQFEKLKVPDVIAIRPAVYEDERGFFMEELNRNELRGSGIEFDVAQVNHSFSRKGCSGGFTTRNRPTNRQRLSGASEERYLMLQLI